MALGEFGQQRSRDPAIDDQRRIALDLAGIIGVVVDTVAVIGDGGIAKQQPRIGGERDADGIRRDTWWRRFGARRRSRFGGRAIDEILLLHDALHAFAGNAVANGQEDHRPAAALFRCQGDDARNALQGGTDRYRGWKGCATAGEHPAGQRDRRQEFAACRMAVRPKARLSGQRSEERDMPAFGHRHAPLQPSRVLVEQRREAPEQGQTGLVLGDFFAAYPGFQRGDIHARPPPAAILARAIGLSNPAGVSYYRRCGTGG